METQPRTRPAWFFPTPWQTPSFGFYIPLPTMVQLWWLKLWINMHEDTSIRLWKQSTTSVGPVRSTPGKTTQLPPWMTYQYVFVSVCMFFRWLEAFLSHKANVLTVEEKVLENMCPTRVYLPQPPAIKELTSLGKLYNPEQKTLQNSPKLLASFGLRYCFLVGVCCCTPLRKQTTPYKLLVYNFLILLSHANMITYYNILC